jgi:hypothetical protein
MSNDSPLDREEDLEDGDGKNDPNFLILLGVVHDRLAELGIENPEDDRLGPIIKHTVDEVLAKAASHLLEDATTRAPKILRVRHRERKGFQKRLYKLWGRALDALYLLIEFSRESGERYHRSFKELAPREHDFIFEAHVRLHVKACQVSSEIWHLLAAGYPMGAHARWRTLHEIAVVSGFLADQDNDTAERYLRHEIIEAFDEMEEYCASYERLGYKPLDPQYIQTLSRERDELVNKYGREFRHTHGWAASALGLKRPTLRDLEAAVRLDHYRPFYGMANHGVHAGSRGLFFNLGRQPGERLPIAGASNGGLADPGHATAISLVQIWTGMTVKRCRTEDLIIMHMMSGLAEKIGEEFIRAHLIHEKRTRQQRQQQRTDEPE